MPNKSINYAVAAPTVGDVSRLAGLIRAKGENELADWIGANGKHVYGASADNWAPFLGDTIEEIVSRSGVEALSLTESLEKAAVDPTRASGVIGSVDVYFLDLFAFFMDRYGGLASRFDLHLSTDISGKCCFLICYKLSPDLQDRLVLSMQSTWCSVCDSYKRGSMHRIAAREEDVLNFLGMVSGKYGLLTGPHPAAAGAVARLFDGDNCGRGGMPSLGSGGAG
jgi:hypothetical protein